MKIEFLILPLALFTVISCRHAVAASGSQDPPRVTVQSGTALPQVAVTAGRTLFLKNCAHCHGADAHGDDGPDLHKLDVSDSWIAGRIRDGKAGQMTAFRGKLKPAEIATVIAYLHTLD